MPRILVACEFSGRVRDAFRALGHDAWSCDLLPTDAPGPHVQCDIRELDLSRVDLLIAHPPCTSLCNSGVRWLHTKPGRWQQMEAAADFFRWCLSAPVPRIAVENPVMHGHARALVGRSPDFTVQPWMFGDGEIKRTCFWTKGLPPLVPTNIVEGRHARVHRAAPSPERWKLRSLTPLGLAAAMASQWGSSLGTG